MHLGELTAAGWTMSATKAGHCAQQPSKSVAIADYFHCCLLQGFNAWIDQCVADSPQPGICLFPEGEQCKLIQPGRM